MSSTTSTENHRCPFCEKMMAKKNNNEFCSENKHRWVVSHQNPCMVTCTVCGKYEYENPHQK